MLENLNNLTDSNITVIIAKFFKIEDKCIKNPITAEFVELVTCFDNDTLDLSNQLRSFLYQLGYTISNNYMSDCSSISELANFLSNINDDLYFYVYQNDRGLWCVGHEDYTHNITQDLAVLINAAKANVEYYKVKDAKRLARLKNYEESKGDVGC